MHNKPSMNRKPYKQVWRAQPNSTIKIGRQKFTTNSQGKIFQGRREVVRIDVAPRPNGRAPRRIKSIWYK